MSQSICCPRSRTRLPQQRAKQRECDAYACVTGVFSFPGSPRNIRNVLKNTQKTLGTSYLQNLLPQILFTRPGRRRLEVSALPLFSRVALNMQAFIACVLDLVTCHLNQTVKKSISQRRSQNKTTGYHSFLTGNYVWGRAQDHYFLSNSL